MLTSIQDFVGRIACVFVVEPILSDVTTSYSDVINSLAGKHGGQAPNPFPLTRLYRIVGPILGIVKMVEFLDP